MFSTVGMLSTVRSVQYRKGCSVPWGYPDAHGRYHEYSGVFSTVGENPLLFEYPTVLNTLLKLQKMVSPHGTQDNPHGTHDIFHSTEHPYGTQDIPHIYHDITPRYFMNTANDTEHSPGY